MEFRLLGPLEVVDGDRTLSLGARKQRVVLARLLIRANRMVPIATLIDEVWGDHPPAAVRNSLQTYISHLRQALGEERIRTGPGGYGLIAESDEIDVHRFQSLVADAQGQAGTDPAAAVESYTHALAMWRGPAFGDINDEPSLAGEIARLEELRLSAIEHKLDAELACGRHRHVIAELEALIAEAPTRERYRAQLMLALYRSGRQAEALAVYRTAEQALVEQLGIDPSRELRELQVQILRQDPSLEPPSDTDALRPASPERPRRHRSRRMPIVVVATAVIAASGVSMLVARSTPDLAGALVGLDPGIVVLDANTGESVGFIPTDVVSRPVEVIFAEDSFWVLNLEPMEFVQVDPDDGSVLRRIASPIDDVGYFTVSGNDLWVTHWTKPIMSKVDITRGREVARFDDLPGTGGSGGVIVADGSLWVARRHADDVGMLARLDPETGEPQHLFHRLPGTLSVAYGDDGGIWTAGSSGIVNRVDPATDTVTSTPVGGRVFYVSAGAGYGWTADEARGVVHQVDSGGRLIATHPTGWGARVVSFAGGKLWVANQDDGTVSAIDVATASTTTFVFGHPVQAVAAGAGRVLVEIVAGRTFDAIVDELGGSQGQVARLFTDGYDFDPPEPAMLTTDFGRQILDATCAGLVRYGDDGRIVPELSVAVPEVSADGRTFIFTIAQGYAFSPPSGAPVTADTVRASLERALSPQFGDTAPGPRLISDISGQSAYTAGEADHISGLVVRGNQFEITLVEPAPDFLDRLASPTFCPVPDGTPVIPGLSGAALPVDDGIADEFLIPSAGPYYVAHQAHGEYTILRRNPNYQGPRAHRLEVIALRGGVDPARAVELVQSGTWDGITNLQDDDGRELDRFTDRIGCIRTLPDDIGVDLAALCLATG